MNPRRQRGTTLVVGLMLLAVVTLLGLAGATGARVELQLAHDEQFRENAATAASAGIEYAIRRIVSTSSSEIAAAPSSMSAPLSGQDRFETITRFVGYETALPQEPGARLVGAHFEITSTGDSARNAIDRQRAGVMWVFAAETAAPTECAPAVEVRCHQPGELLRLSWQRLAAP
jgi:Tfp pilus assembly protein PilX